MTFQRKRSDFFGKGCYTMGERMGRIGRIETDFFWARVLAIREKSKKSASIRPIRPIRSPIVSHIEIYWRVFCQVLPIT
jgi:hypothetical protein